MTRTLWLRHQLVPGHRTVTSTTDMVGHLLGLKAQDNLPPYLSVAARIDDFVPREPSGRIENRSLARLFSMRGTVHVLRCTCSGARAPVHVLTADDALQLRGWVQPALDRVSATNQTSRPANHLTTEQLDAVVGPLLGDGAKLHIEIGRALAAVLPDVPEVAAARHAGATAVVQVPPRGL